MALTRLRRAQVVAIILAVVVQVSVVLVGLRLYAYPDTDAPAPTDAVLVIGPPTPTRIAIAQRMVDAGLTSNVVISVPPPGSDSPGFEASALPICSQPQTFTVYCVTPSPFTTQGEGRALQSLAASHGWTSATVITFTPHILRARIIMELCFTGDLRMVADRAPIGAARWIYEAIYQTSAFVKVLAEPSC
ncbi:hypothetical protein B7R22_15705 [Subtercola boreus]|uniref:DUF218 domain-containing protein n=1 Tax=Subtercola boreus TaxID=120213 RepID=A0A3E0VT22_9MICO|nr:YdcF family protein [Subtercola boreus]RFA12558.1 hypothetical protein B7R22_15705 [Subtercola boreus]